MNRSVIRYLIGKILQVEAGLLLFPLIVSFIYQEPSWQKLSYASVIVLLGILGTLATFKRRTAFKIRAQEGIVTVALAWILLSAFGALPLFVSGEIPNYIDAFFEISSGFTTTGASILPDLSVLSHSSLFWRSFTHMVGGMGVLVFTLAIMSSSGSDSIHLLKAEVPGPVFGKLVSRVSHTAKVLYEIYLAMTFILVLILVLVKVPLFDALLLAFGTAGTGGFSINNAGLTIYENQALIEWILGVGMLVFGINFNLYYFALIGYAKEFFKDEELKYYLGMILAAILTITLVMWTQYQDKLSLIRHAFFNVVSVVTTTGYATTDFGQWSLLLQSMLLFLMFVGGSAGSTAGGLKVSRVVIYIKSGLVEFKRIVSPGRVMTPRLSGKPISRDLETQTTNYLLVYIFIFIVLLFAVSIEAPDFMTAFSTVTATFNNIGPGLGTVGPSSNFSAYSDVTTFLLSITMIAGRLEIYPIILLFSPKVIRKLLHHRKVN